MSTTHETDDIKQIGQILADQIQSLRTLLDASTEQIQRPEGLAVIASKIVAVPVAEAQIRQLFQLHNSVKRTGFSAGELVEIRRKQVVDANLEDSDRQMLERGFKNFSSLANVVSIELTAKAIELAYASDNLLQSTRILTDVRPLFSDDAQSIDGAVVAHTVRLLKEISSCELDATLRDASNGAPTHVCRAVASKVAQDLYLAHQMRPVRVAASVEGDIMLVYRDHPNLEMEIEIDNVGDATGVISTEETVLMSAMVTLPAEFSRLVTAYRIPTTSVMRRTN